MWVPTGDMRHLNLSTDHGALGRSIEAHVDGGIRLTLDIPRGVRTIRIQGPRGQDVWSLGIGEKKTRAEIDSLVALGRTGKYEQALRSLEALRARTSEQDTGPIDAAIGRMALALGDVDRAERGFRAAIAASKAEGRLADVMLDGSALLWALVHLQQRYVDARVLLAELTPFGEQFAEGRALLNYDAGLLAADTGEIRASLERYRDAERLARRLALPMTDNTAEEVARLLVRVGRIDEAIAKLKGLPPPSEPCARATRALNLVWALMEAAASRGKRDRDVAIVDALDAAKTATSACPDTHRRLLALLNAAEYALQVGDDAEVERLASQIVAMPSDRDVLRASRRADVLGQWHLGRGRPAQALVEFENQIFAARGAGLLEETFHGEVGAGRALSALGRRGAAVARLKEAQKILERMLRWIPMGEGRGSFLGGHDDGVRFLVATLVAGGALREAFRAARWARAVEVAHTARLDRLARLSPEARRYWDEAVSRYQRIRGEIERQAEDDWRLPRSLLVGVRSDRHARAEKARVALDDAYRLLFEVDRRNDFQLSHPSRGDLYLAFFPGSTGWLAFAATRAGVVARRIEESWLSSPIEATKILDLFETQLALAHNVRVFPYGAADRLDWQAVLWKGRPLLSLVTVEYGLDVGTRLQADPVVAAPLNALVISNPTGDLPEATSEADGVARALSAWQVTRLDGPAATRSATLASLPTARLFHYAGHAELSNSEPLSSALVLGGRARVELGDLLAIPSVPDLVVMSACEAAGSHQSGSSLMGLAQAFIAAGARAAIAPTRPIRDADARAFVAAFYASFVKGDAGRTAAAFGRMEDIRAAFRDAALAIESEKRNVPGETRERTGWESFRLLVP
jgi:tetratricopeptide (TPR) repeat protein